MSDRRHLGEHAAVHRGAYTALHEVADIIAGMHSIEERQAGSTLPIGSIYDKHSARAEVLAELAFELQKLCVEAKVQPPPALALVSRKRVK